MCKMLATTMAMFVLGALATTRVAHAQIGYEVEWNVPTMIINEGPNGGMVQPARSYTAGYDIGVKMIVGKYQNWYISVDNVSHNPQGLNSCDPAVRALFPRAAAPGLPVPGGVPAVYPVPAGGDTQGLFAWNKQDIVATTNNLGNRRRNYCGQGIIEFQTATPRTTQAQIAQDFQDLRNYMLAWETAAALPTVARAGGAPPLPGVYNANAITNGCANTFPCVLRFPFYRNKADATNQVNARADTYWHVVIPQAGLGGGVAPLATQINVDIPLSYFANVPAGPTAPTGTQHNAFLYQQFGNLSGANSLWSLTAGWNFGNILTNDRKGFYRLIGWYSRLLDQRIGAHAPMGGFLAGGTAYQVWPKNTINPNPKFDPCELRNDFWNVGKYLRRFYQGAGATVVQITNPLSLAIIGNAPPANCSFVTRDVTRVPLDGGTRPVFEFRYPGNHACWDLVRWARIAVPPAAGAAGGLTTLSTACAAALP